MRMLKIGTLILLISTGVACSGSKKSTNEYGDETAATEEIPGAFAGTDAVPQDSVEPYPSMTAPSEFAAEGSGVYDSYTVQTGDTLMKIAFEYYGDLYQWRKIYDLNRSKITDFNQLPNGLVLQIEKPAVPVVIERNGERYLIKTGDTLGTISNDVYGTKTRWRQIWENNRQLIKDPNKIYAGFYLYYVPDGQGVTPLAGQDAPTPGFEEQPAPSMDTALPTETEVAPEEFREPAAN